MTRWEFVPLLVKINQETMKKIKRDIFFWLERLQITRKERVVISSLLVIVVLMIALTATLRNTYTTNNKNYEEILKEFAEKSARIKKEKEYNEAKYSGLEVENIEALSKPKSDVEMVMVNINKADLTELQKLKGIGKTYAQRIIDYRQENGEFKNIEELLNIKGIGKKRLEAIEAFIILK